MPAYPTKNNRGTGKEETEASMRRHCRRLKVLLERYCISAMNFSKTCGYVSIEVLGDLSGLSESTEANGISLICYILIIAAIIVTNLASSIWKPLSLVVSFTGCLYIYGVIVSGIETFSRRGFDVLDYNSKLSYDIKQRRGIKSEQWLCSDYSLKRIKDMLRGIRIHSVKRSDPDLFITVYYNEDADKLEIRFVAGDWLVITRKSELLLLTPENYAKYMFLGEEHISSND